MKQISKEALTQVREFLYNKEEKVSAVLVVKSKRTGKDFTYKIIADTRRGTRIITILLEGFGQKFTPVHYAFDFKPNPIKDLKYKTSEGYAGAVWLLDKILENEIDLILEKTELYHISKCLKCNRPLTDLTSIEYGIGPICRGESKESQQEQQPYNREQ